MKYESFRGGCLCGSTQYELVSEPITLYACHCTDCQTASGSICTLIMRLPSDGLKIVAGNPEPFERARTDGRKKLIFRCPACLTALWGSHATRSEYVSLYAGTLDKSSMLSPIGHIWTNSAQSWVSITKGTLNHGSQPSDMKLFDEAWRKQNA